MPLRFKVGRTWRCFAWVTVPFLGEGGTCNSEYGLRCGGGYTWRDPGEPS